MDEVLSNWYLFPTSILIATVAMTSGIGGAVFFSPLFMLVLRLEPAVAIGTALITELFGFSSGVYAYWSRGLIDFRLGRALLLFAAPAAVAGSLSADLFPADVLRTIFATGIIFIGAQLYLSYRREDRERLDRDIESESVSDYASVLRDTAGREYRYTVCNRNQGRLFAATGGLFLGMISVGLAELQEYHLLARCRVPSPVAVGTSIFVVVVSVVLASAVHVYNFTTAADAVALRQVGSVVAFTVPGVIIGGQIGPFVQARVDPELTKVWIAVLFMVVGGIMLATLV